MVKTRIVQFYSSLILLAVCSSCGNGNSGKTENQFEHKVKIIRIKGSETIRPVIEKVIRKFADINPDVYIEYEGGGSNIGLMAIAQQEVDIAFASRPMTKPELYEIDTTKKYSCVNLAFDGLCIIVNINNPVKELNLSQLQSIYSGEKNNWKEFGGKDLPIIVYSRDVSSGTYSFFKDKVMGAIDYRKDDINLIHNEEIVNNVLQSNASIGYVGHGDIKPNLRVLKIATGVSTKYIEPNYGSVKSGEYPLSRNIYYLYSRNAPAYVLQLDSFFKSPTVKEIIADIGFIPE